MMLFQFLAALQKELLLLRRDRSALLVLFAMPAVLVLVLTLVQENALKTIGQGETRIVFVNNDTGEVGRKIEQSLRQAGGVTLVTRIDGKVPDPEAAIAAVAQGDFQLCLVVPAGMTDAIKAGALASARQALAFETTGRVVDTAPPMELNTYFDPTVLGGFRSAVKHLLQLLLLKIEVEHKIAALTELLPRKMQHHLQTRLGSVAEQVPVDEEALRMEWDPSPLVMLNDRTATHGNRLHPANAVQQNVPAWSLFGVFFVVLPMAGSFIKERLCGVQQRMLSLPVSYPVVLSGKVVAYILICMAQFALILCIGKWLLPLLGSDAFEIGSEPGSVALVALSAVLAATGYGILLGTVINSYEQAAMFGPISIVVAAAIGGIMVPVYVMPEAMQSLSVVSPLAWGQNAFQILFVRGGGLKAVLAQVAALWGFALACMGVSWWWFTRKMYRRT
jgi:ABC-2 type transport system permease protein